MSLNWGKGGGSSKYIYNQNGFQNDPIQGWLEKMLLPSSEFGRAISVAFLDLGLF